MIADPGAARPAALAAFADVAAALGPRPAVFLDYDGTLTPIVSRPELAVLAPAMRAAVQRLAALCPVAVVSGRDLDDVRARVGLPGLVYAGSHGFDIAGPGLRHRVGEEWRPALAAAAAALEPALAGVGGVLVESKGFAIAVHTRQVAPADKPAVAAAVRRAAADAALRVTGGKEIAEIRPPVPWDKGRAVRHLLEVGGLDGAVPLFVGDDDTDEDGFRAVAALAGAGIRVGDAGAATAARWVLPDPAAVGVFLERLAAWLETARHP
ncbi:trehalose 6-phosphate phosphatase [Azospirillum fermentarium]|uniref:trehalose-phosphatase n=1 Tax=Azospirillum fermentarium TaxID=1233114 RepID=UPI0022270CBA|nr:trehalose-phosphatase [Azospirillum fermentarium]MCW2244602.1 trehalose 6-phosphate phosphatase [Azospirillum fermentarium]